MPTLCIAHNFSSINRPIKLIRFVKELLIMPPDVIDVKTLAIFELLVSFADGEQRHFLMKPNP
jgi:hypothetical protein